MIIKKYLYSRDTKGKIRVLILSIVETMFSGSLSETTTFTIMRQSGLLDGAKIQQPNITLHKGKAGRTLKQQVELQVNSIISKQRDKGYKLLAELTSGDIDPLDYAEIDKLLPAIKTYVNGSQKLMLAKDPKVGTKYFKKDGTPTEKWNDDWYVSRKLDGIRSAVFLDSGDYKAISRTGKSQNIAFSNIFRNTDLMKIFTIIGEDKMIDGELYQHGKRLQYLSGVVQKGAYDPLYHDGLEFWIFDYADDTTTAEERAKKLNAIVPLLKGTSIKINIQTKVNNYAAMKVLHDKWVLDGYEGLIARKADALYGYGKRDERMIKLKEFQDDEFEIVGHKLGLRGAEDMCFICKTEDGLTFDPKPIGDRQVKLNYVADMHNLIGKMATVKFFNYTKDGIPNLPALVCVRDYE